MGDYLSTGEMELLIQELVSLQAELESQNEELRASLEMEEELRNRYADLFDHAPVGYITLDRDGRIAKANFTVASLLGMERNHLAGLVFYRFLKGSDGEEFRKHHTRVMENGGRQTCELEITPAGGGSFFAHLESVRSGDGKGADSFCRTVIEDISDNRHLRDELEAERSRLMAVIDSAPEGIVVTDDRARILMANTAAEKLAVRKISFGRERESSSELELCRLNGAPYDSRDFPLSRSALHGETLKRVDMVLRGPGDRERVLLANTAPIRDERGRVRGAVGIFQDITEQRRASDYLRLLEARYRAVVEDIPFIICRFHPDGTITFVNELLVRYSNRSSEELLGSDVYSLLPEHLREKMRDLQRAMSPGDNVRISSFSITAPDGSVHWYRWIAHAIFDGDRLMEYQVIGEDITEQHRMEEALRESEERYRIVSRLMSDFAYLFRVDSENTVVLEWVAGPIETISGYTPEELGTLDRWIDLVYHEDRDWVVERVRACMERPGTTVVEYRVVTKPGEVRWFQVNTNSMWDESEGRIVRIYGAARDVTGRRRAEEALRESEKRYRLVSELTSDYSCAYRVLPGPAVQLEWTTGAFARITGYTREEVNAIGWKKMIHPGDTFKAENAMRTAITDGVDTVGEARIVNRAGRTLLLRLYLHPERNPATGEVEWVYAAAQDITERRSLEEKVGRLRREQEALAAHEVKNLLIPLHIYVESLAIASEGALNDEQARYLRKIRENTDRAFDFIQYFTRIHDLETGTFTLKKSRTSLESIVSQAVLDLTPVAEKNGVRVEFASDGGASDLNMDVLLMPGVFTNLILNAIEHVAPLHDPAEKTVRVSLVTGKRRLMVKVHNRGEPIPPERLAAFFERFNVGESKKAGVGLGTTYALLVVRAHGGEISVASGEGEGTTVNVWFK